MNYTAVIIGSGPAGYTSAIRIAQLGGNVALVERDLVGGICVNWGCTPSKAMISSAKIAKTLKSASHYGIQTGEMEVDFNRVAARRDEVIARSREEIRHLLEHHGVELIHGSARIAAAHEVIVSLAAGGEQTLEAQNIIIASGSQPLVPPFLQKEDSSIVNSNRLITIKDLPEQLTIVGGGIIGLEFATMFAHFGTKVRIIELMDRVLALMDPEISVEITKELEAIGVEVLTSRKVLDISNGVIKLENPADGSTSELASPLNLIAIGRKPVFESAELQALGIEHDHKGIKINDNLQTTLPHIYAIGDASGRSILAHVAIQQGIIAAENIMGRINNAHENRVMDYSVIPAVVYTLPEVATVGTVPADLKGVGIYKFPFSANLRANIEEHNAGFVKMWVAEQDQKLIAVQIVGDYAGEIIQAYADIIAAGTPIETIANTIHAHPTYNEIVRNSLEHVLGRAIEYID